MSSILVKRLKSKSYRARSLALPDVVAEASTRDEAIQKVRERLQLELAESEVVDDGLSELVTTNPWLAIAGSWKDRQDLDRFADAIRDYRRQVDEDPNRL